MAKGTPTINLELERAQSALTVLKTLLADKLHEDDRKDLDSMIDKATSALDKASNILSDLRCRINDAVDQF